MNLVGKIFTVFIFVMSLVFATSAVLVYATHTNWKTVVDNPEDKATRDKPAGLKYQVAQNEQDIEKLEDEKLTLEAEKQKEHDLRIARATQLESELRTLKEEYETKHQENERLVAELGRWAAEAKAARDRNESLRTANDQQRGKILTAQTQRDGHFKEVVSLTEDVHQAVNEVKRLRALQLELARQLADSMEVNRMHGLVSDPSRYPGPPETLEGVVVDAVGSGMVTISVGSDDGLLKGHRLHVIRNRSGTSSFVGRVEVVRVSPDKAVCVEIPETMQSHVRSDDIVKAKI